jgi:hypothetical protein
MQLGKFGKAKAAIAISEDCFAVEFETRTAEPLAFEPRATHAGANAFPDQRPFEFANRPHYDDEGTTQRTSRVQSFAHR